MKTFIKDYSGAWLCCIELVIPFSNNKRMDFVIKLFMNTFKAFEEKFSGCMKKYVIFPNDIHIQYT